MSACSRETLHPWAIKKKGYKNPISNLTHGTTSFQFPLHDPMQPFSSLQIKSFSPLLLKSTFAFNLRADPRTLNS
jgi:hypothetical protein